MAGKSQVCYCFATREGQRWRARFIQNSDIDFMDNKSLFQWLAWPLVSLATLVGCASLPWMEKERTSVVTPRMRVAAIQEIGARASEADASEQEKLSRQLATQIQAEPDPLVRRAIQESISQFPTPLAKQVLIAGLQDENLDVRLACCHALGQRADADTVTVLRGTLENDAALDVQLAVVDALGKIKSPESVAALAVAVNDRDPALQYAAVQSLKSISGKQLGNEVAAWRAYAASPNPEISVADRSSGWSPF